MTNKEFQEYLHSVAINKADRKNYRMGQAYFNTLQDLYPEIAHDFRGSRWDPFYDDNVIGKFLYELHASYVKE